MTSISPAGSMKGWRFGTWAAGLLEFRKWLGSVKNSLKTLLVAGIAIGVFYLQPFATSTWGEAIAGLFCGAIAKLVTDSIDYCLSRYELPPD